MFCTTKFCQKTQISPPYRLEFGGWLISRKFWVIEKWWNFHNVRCAKLSFKFTWNQFGPAEKGQRFHGKKWYDEQKDRSTDFVRKCPFVWSDFTKKQFCQERPPGKSQRFHVKKFSSGEARVLKFPKIEALRVIIGEFSRQIDSFLLVVLVAPSCGWLSNHNKLRDLCRKSCN